MSAHPYDRRQVVRHAAGLLGGVTLLGSRASGAVRVLASRPIDASAAQRTLVLLQLSGGNDGLSTVVPFAEDAYQRARPSLALREEDVLVLDERRGLHRALTQLRARYDGGQFAIVEGAGYPDPIRSHFKSLEVWHTASSRGRAVGDGWVGRLCDRAWPDTSDPNLVIHVGPNVPYSLQSNSHPPAAFVNPRSYRWAGGEPDTEAFEKAGEMGPEPASESLDFLRKVLSDSQASSLEIRRAAARYRPGVEYPTDAFGAALRDVAALIHGELGSRVFSVELGGFDTHTQQKGRHDALMRALDGGLGAFLADLDRTDAGRDTLVLVFSEFGRRVRENGSRGTDHGVAAPMFALGRAVRGGIYGRPPSFASLDEGDLTFTTDFRCAYATVIERWFRVPHEPVLGARYAPLAFLA